MAHPAHSFYDRDLYIRQQEKHVRNAAIREGEFYNAFSLLYEPEFSNHESVVFPVRMGPLAMRMILLDEDFFQTAGGIPGIIENGVWEVKRPIHIEKGTPDVEQGYLLRRLPGDPRIDHVYKDRHADPSS